MTRHIGIVAVSAEGAALCYRTICSEAPELLGTHMHPEISMHTHPLGEYMPYCLEGRWEEVADLMVSSARKLTQIGAELLLCPDNTVHEAFDSVKRRTSVPWLHIADEVSAVAAVKGYDCLGVLGTGMLMEGPVYATSLQARGISYQIPEESERREINRCIFEELVLGKFTDESRNYFVRVVEALQDRGCDAVVLGCTEIPLLVTEADLPVPALDSTRLLARAALRHAL